MKKILIVIVAVMALVSCTVSYKFNGASIDYTKTKTITIDDFPIRTPLVYTPLGITFNEGLKDIFTRQTRLNFVKTGGDLQLEGEITEYNVTPQAVKQDAYASETRLTVGVKVRFTNLNKPDEDFERSFSAYRDFPATSMLTDVQDELISEMVTEITESIFNATVANW